MSRLRLFQIAGIIALLLFVFITTAAAHEPPLLHPCHPGGGGGPGVGPPCPPTATPAFNADDASAASGPGGPISFRLVNRTQENITLWLGEPVRYVLNVAGNSEQVFTIERSVYSYQMISCSKVSAGFMNLTVHTFYNVEPCRQTRLVRVALSNDSGRDLALQMSGEAEYVFPMSSGQTRSLTIARGDYTVSLFGCGVPASMEFEARSGRALSLTCP